MSAPIFGKMSEAQVAIAFELMNMATENPNGIYIRFPNAAEAMKCRQRCYKARTGERQRNSRTAPDGVTIIPGKTTWDRLLFKITKLDSGESALMIFPAELELHLMQIFDPITGEQIKTWIN